MTEKGHRDLQEELQRLKRVERPAASKAIEIARAHGDLSENAEYHAAKEHQGMLEAKIKILESRMSTAQVVDVSKLSGDRVVFGATVVIEDVDNGDEKTIVIVGDEEADAARGYISYQSPLARALIGKNLDDIAKVRLPSGEREYEITSVKFIPLK
jgi:transcription elongation factor GreA